VCENNSKLHGLPPELRGAAAGLPSLSGLREKPDDTQRERERYQLEVGWWFGTPTLSRRNSGLARCNPLGLLGWLAVARPLFYFGLARSLCTCTAFNSLSASVPSICRAK